MIDQHAKVVTKYRGVKDVANQRQEEMGKLRLDIRSALARSGQKNLANTVGAAFKLAGDQDLSKSMLDQLRDSLEETQTRAQTIDPSVLVEKHHILRRMWQRCGTSAEDQMHFKAFIDSSPAAEIDKVLITEIDRLEQWHKKAAPVLRMLEERDVLLYTMMMWTEQRPVAAARSDSSTGKALAEARAGLKMRTKELIHELDRFEKAERKHDKKAQLSLGGRPVGPALRADIKLPPDAPPSKFSAWFDVALRNQTDDIGGGSLLTSVLDRFIGHNYIGP